MSKSPRKPLLSLPVGGPPPSPHTRSASLSIARSPLLSPSNSAPLLHSRGLSYTSNTPLGRISDDDDEQNTDTKSSPNAIFPLRTGQYASDLDDATDDRELLHRRKIKSPHTAVSRNIGHTQSRANDVGYGDDDSADLAELEHDIEALDTDVAMGDATSRTEDYSGPFQPPVGREAMGIVISLTAVGLLAVVACLTTVYDWVL